MTKEIATTANTGLAKVAIQCSLPVPVQAGADTFLVNHPPAGGLRINPYSYQDSDNHHLRQARKTLTNCHDLKFSGPGQYSIILATREFFSGLKKHIYKNSK